MIQREKAVIVSISIVEVEVEKGKEDGAGIIDREHQLLSTDAEEARDVISDKRARTKPNTFYVSLEHHRCLAHVIMHHEIMNT